MASLLPFRSWFILMALLAVIIDGSLYDSLANGKLERMKKLVEITHEKLLAEGCDEPESERMKRSLLSLSVDDVKLETQTELYNKLIDMIISCRKSKLQTTTSISTVKSSSTAKSVKSSSAAKLAHSLTTSMKPSLPKECVGAINLTESWRQNYTYQPNFKPKNGEYNCDIQDMVDRSRPWFRFTGDAGTRLMNTCPPNYSCGTMHPLWSDEPESMPSEIGVVSSFKVVEEYSNHKCDKAVSTSMSALRCSNAPNDLVYRYDGSPRSPAGGSRCRGFCGIE